MSEKPPIGIKPRWKLTEERISEINGALVRYLLAQKEIPHEWIEELSELLAWRNGYLSEEKSSPW